MGHVRRNYLLPNRVLDQFTAQHEAAITAGGLSDRPSIVSTLCNTRDEETNV